MNDINIFKEVEPLLDKFISNIGGERVDTQLSENVEYRNADYKVDFSKYLIELKCFEIDQATSKSFHKRLYDHHKDHFEYLSSLDVEGIDAKSVADETMRRFSEDIIKALEPPIANTIKSANRQLRETKENLQLHDYAGAVWLVNENNLILQPNYLVEIICDILEKPLYSSIDVIIISNVNLHVISEKTKAPSLYWVPIFREKTEKIAIQFTQYIGHRWEEFVRNEYNIPSDTKSLTGFFSLPDGDEELVNWNPKKA